MKALRHLTSQQLKFSRKLPESNARGVQLQLRRSQTCLRHIIEARVRVQCKLELTQLLSAVAALVHADWDEDEKQRGTLNVSWD